jgi:hypothetical protein
MGSLCQNSGAIATHVASCQLWGAVATLSAMFFSIGKTGRLCHASHRVNHDEVLLHCARIGFNP